jgi:hypothetical protein
MIHLWPKWHGLLPITYTGEAFTLILPAGHRLEGMASRYEKEVEDQQKSFLRN